MCEEVRIRRVERLRVEQLRVEWLRVACHTRRQAQMGEEKGGVLAGGCQEMRQMRERVMGEWWMLMK
jgi:hypothetical protein